MPPPDFLIKALANKEHGKICRLHVTLTFAQSTDAKIAGKNGQQLLISGKESMLMTHWMRSMHDGIMVGIGTALNDNPQLNTRLLPQNVESPIPIVVDSHLRLPLESKLVQNYVTGKGKQPWVLYSRDALESGVAVRSRREQLEKAGIRILAVELGQNNRLSIESILTTLHGQGLESLMVEGGAQIINAFLAENDAVDALIVTVAPLLVGTAGVGFDVPDANKSFQHVSTEVVGPDTVFCWNRA